MFTLHIESMSGGPTHEHTFSEGVLIIGRSQSKCDIVLPADNVSRTHARVYTVDERCYLEDLNSANGVFVDGARIRGAQELDSRTQFRIGDYLMRVTSKAESERESPELARLEGFNLFEGRTYPIYHDVALIGRGKDTTVTVIDASVSRMHAKLTRSQAGEFFLQDLRSANGTLVNERRVEEQVVSHGDRIRFGNVDFRLLVAGQPALAPMPRTATPDDLEATRREEPLSETRSDFDEDADYDFDDEIVVRRRWPIWVALGIVVVAAAVLLAVFLPKSEGDEVEPTEDAHAAAAVSAEEEEAEREREREERRRGRMQAALLEELEKMHSALNEERWADTIVAGRVALALDPENEAAGVAIANAEQEQVALVAYERGEAARLDRRFGEALAHYESIPRQSVYRKRGNDRVAALRALRPELLAEAEDLRRRNRGEACARLREALLIDADEESLSRALRALLRRCP
jgi:pSer/pThr/pTyr-binding forkhead associated (FHA) protein